MYESNYFEPLLYHDVWHGRLVSYICLWNSYEMILNCFFPLGLSQDLTVGSLFFHISNHPTSGERFVTRNSWNIASLQRKRRLRHLCRQVARRIHSGHPSIRPPVWSPRVYYLRRALRLNGFGWRQGHESRCHGPGLALKVSRRKLQSPCSYCS